ncbi:MAG: ThuA domain-containing protein [Treponema sp.]|jgi:type 1 glutamine amidotransferase|nr:ThuA domain-containing protein [Treponema sp.]
MKRKALILCGGWAGHEPVQITERFKGFLESEDFEVIVSETIEILEDRDLLMSLDLFVPAWTQGELKRNQGLPVLDAIGAGVGMAGCHGGMCDAFRTNVAWQFVTGANWVAHPGGADNTYKVNIISSSNPLTEGIKDFDIHSEQYYLHVDPAIEVLATTRFPTANWYHVSNGEVDIPVVWTKRWGHGRVYYNSLGHHNDVFDIPEAWELMKRGLLWAADGKRIAQEKGLSAADFLVNNNGGNY